MEHISVAKTVQRPPEATRAPFEGTLPYFFSSNGASVLDEKKRSRRDKGLKILSEAVRSYVAEREGSSYAEVSEALKDIQGQVALKDQKNVKRRVYDALNVLVAAGVLRKH